jgi:O-antigen/teichoic acid export membrane protein
MSEVSLPSKPSHSGDFAARLVGPGIWSLAIKVLSAGLSYIMLVIFARLMPPSEYGRFAVSFNLAIFLSAIFGFGFPTGITRLWPEYRAKNKPGIALGILRVGLQATITGSLALVAGSVLLVLASRVWPALSFSRNITAIALFAAATGFGDFFAATLRAQGQTIWSMAPRDVIWRIVAPLVAVLAVWLGFAMNHGTAVYLCATLLLAICGIQALRIRHSIREAGVAASAETEWPSWRKSLLTMWAAAIVYTMIQQLDVVIVGSLLSNEDAAGYFAAQKTASLLGLVMIAGGLAYAPVMASFYHAGKIAELRSLCRHLVLAISIVTLLGFGFVALAGGQLLSLFDPSFVSAYGVLIILAVGFSIDAIAGPTAYLMQMTSYEGAYLKIMLTCYGGVVLAQSLLIPHYGIIGAALASAGGTILWNVWAIFLLRSKAGIDPSILSFLLPLPPKQHGP